MSDAAPRIDLHTHSAVSDGTARPADLVAEAKAAGLDIVALTDHDTFDGLDEAQEAALAWGIEVVDGIEISCEHDGNSVHLLGYWCDRDDEALGVELQRSRDGRSGRVEAMAARLTALGMPLTADDILDAAQGSPSVGRPHVADAMIAKGHVRDRTEAFAKWLADDKPGFVHRYATPLEVAIDLVHGAGGVAVIAHPWGRGRAQNLPAAYLTTLVTEHGLDGIEVDHQDHDAATRTALRALARELGVVATGSSDHHGTGKVNHDLGVNLTAPDQFAQLVQRAAERGAGLG